MDLLESLMPIAQSVGMGFYFQQLQRECLEKREQRLSILCQSTDMKKILDNNKPGVGQLLLINAENGNERKSLHLWAERNGYYSKSAKTNYFDSVYIYHCYECASNFYQSEMRREHDWSTVTPGVCFGVTNRCPNCGAFYYDDDDNNDVKRKGRVFNTVLIGHQIPEMDKTVSRKRSKRIKRFDDDSSFVLSLKEFKLIELNDFNPKCRDEQNDEESEETDD